MFTRFIKDLPVYKHVFHVRLGSYIRLQEYESRCSVNYAMHFFDITPVKKSVITIRKPGRYNESRHKK
jgi:hypothetical protein